MLAEQMPAHLDDEHRHRERQRHPEAAAHVDQFRIGLVVERDDIRLQRHAAFRARTGADLPDFRMHRAGIDRAGRSFRLRLFRREEFIRLYLEAVVEALRAEHILRALIGKATALRRFWGDLQAADRIDRERLVLIVMAVIVARMVRGMIVPAATTTRCLLLAVRHRNRLDLYTPRWYMKHMRDEIKSSCQKLLKRIEGQVRGLDHIAE